MIAARRRAATSGVLCSAAMSRLWNVEALVFMFGGLALVIALAVESGLGVYSILPGGAWLLASIPLAISLQTALIPIYLQLGWNTRALELALLIRDAAPGRKLRDLAAVDVSMVHLSAGRLDDALRNFETINVHQLGPRTRALILGNRAYCRAHLGRELDRALGEAREARTVDPDEGLLHYFEGLVLHAQGQHAEARALIESSLAKEPDPRLPFPGERPWVLSEIAKALGDAPEAERRRAEALRLARKGPIADKLRAE